MNKYISTARIVGRIGKEIKFIPKKNGTEFAVFSVATGRSWKDANGEWVESTTWHQIEAHNPKCIEFLKEASGSDGEGLKGRWVSIDAELEDRRWTNKDGNLVINKVSVVPTGYVNLIADASSPTYENKTDLHSDTKTDFNSDNTKNNDDISDDIEEEDLPF